MVDLILLVNQFTGKKIHNPRAESSVDSRPTTALLSYSGPRALNVAEKTAALRIYNSAKLRGRSWKATLSSATSLVVLGWVGAHSASPKFRLHEFIRRPTSGIHG